MNKVLSFSITYLCFILYGFVLCVVSYGVSSVVFAILPDNLKNILSFITIGQDLKIVSSFIVFLVVLFFVTKIFIKIVTKVLNEKLGCLKDYSDNPVFIVSKQFIKILNFIIVVLMVYAFGLSNSRLAYFQTIMSTTNNDYLYEFITREVLIYLIFCSFISMRHALLEAVSELTSNNEKPVSRKDSN